MGQPGRLPTKGGIHLGFKGCLGVDQGKRTDKEATAGRGNCFCWTPQASKATLKHVDFIHGWILRSSDEAGTGRRWDTLGN